MSANPHQATGPGRTGTEAWPDLPKNGWIGRGPELIA